MTTITALPTAPSRSAAPSSFPSQSAAFLAAMGLFRDEMNGRFLTEPPPVDLAGATGALFSGIPAGFSSLEFSFGLLESGTRSRNWALRFGIGAGLLTTSTIYERCHAHLVNATNVQALVPSSGIVFGTNSGNSVYVSGRIINLNSGNKYAIEYMGLKGFNVLGGGILSFSGPLTQIGIVGTTVNLTLPLAGGQMSIRWR